MRSRSAVRTCNDLLNISRGRKVYPLSTSVFGDHHNEGRILQIAHYMNLIQEVHKLFGLTVSTENGSSFFRMFRYQLEAFAPLPRIQTEPASAGPVLSAGSLATHRNTPPFCNGDLSSQETCTNASAAPLRSRPHAMPAVLVPAKIARPSPPRAQLPTNSACVSCSQRGTASTS
jgi:hypothetical protein